MVRNLETIRKRGHRNPYLSQITYIPGLRIIFSKVT